MKVLILLLVSVSQLSWGQACNQGANYSTQELTASTLYSNREISKFPTRAKHFPLPTAARATYCLSRGCGKHLDVTWRPDEIQQLQQLRSQLVTSEDSRSEIKFLKAATLKMEQWLRQRAATSQSSIRNSSGNFEGGDNSSWVRAALSSYGDTNKECVTYAMEASQHLLILANLGLVQHWNIKAPIYRAGVPGHFTAAVQDRSTCAVYRFDLNTAASTRESILSQRGDPMAVFLRSGTLAPGMDSQGYQGHSAPARTQLRVSPAPVAAPASQVTASTTPPTQPSRVVLPPRQEPRTYSSQITR